MQSVTAAGVLDSEQEGFNVEVGIGIGDRVRTISSCSSLLISVCEHRLRHAKPPNLSFDLPWSTSKGKLERQTW